VKERWRLGWLLNLIFDSEDFSYMSGRNDYLQIDRVDMSPGNGLFFKHDDK
jgi:hypothetical protein